MRPCLAIAMWILLASTTVATTAAAAPIRYGAKSLGFLIRSGAYDATTGDFNHDSHPDVVIAHQVFGNDGILLGNGDGMFQPLQVVAPSGNWGTVATGDLNGDTHLDLVVEGVRVYLGNGDGTFDPPVTYSPSYGIIEVIDVDGDGKRDVISRGGILSGNGDGTLGGLFALEAMAAEYWDATDLDGDSDVDIVGARGDSMAIVYLNQGSWSFTIADSFPIRRGDTAYEARGNLRVAMLDGDNIPDLLNDGQFFGGVGDGTFGPAVVFGPEDGKFARVADLDEDGVMDVIDVAQPPDAKTFMYSARVYRGLGGGAFAAPVLHGVQRQTTALVTADFDSDGHVDLALADYTSSGVLQIILGNGDGTFGGGVHDYPVAGTPLKVAIGNVVGTTAPDVLVGNQGVSFLRILPGLGDGSLGAPVDLPTSGEVRAVAVADLDQDGDNDVVTAGQFTVSVFLGMPGGALGPRADFPGGANSIAVGDLNGDGRPDVVVSPTLSTYITQPNGSLGPRTDYGSSGSDVMIAELTGDAYPDVALENGIGSTGYIYVLPGSASGALGAPVTTSFSTWNQEAGYAFTLGSVTGSAAVDAIHGDARNLKVLPGNGNGTFGTTMPATSFIYRDFRSILVPGEWTGDAFNDLLSTNFWWSGFGLSAGSGSGSFALETIYGSGGCPVDLATGDLDGDGRPEVVVAIDLPSNWVTVHRPLPLGPVGVPLPRDDESTLALSRAWPNPTRSVLHMAFSLATSEPASLDLIDLLGRRVHRENVSEPAPGPRTVRLAPARTLAPGLYWLRLSQGSAQHSLKVVVVD